MLIPRLMKKERNPLGRLRARAFLPLFPTLILLAACYIVTTTGINEPLEASKSEQQSREELISSAIDACREKLSQSDPAVAPYAFPKTRRRLALLLESRLPDGDAIEIAGLYVASARNDTESFRLEASERIESFLRAADIILKFGTKRTDITVEEEAESLLREALSVHDPLGGQDTNEAIQVILSEAYATVFEKLVHMILKQVNSAGTSLSRSSNDDYLKQILHSSLELCDQVSDLCPNEPIIDEYRGAIIRKLYGTRNVRHKKSEAFVVSNSGMMMTKDTSIPSFGILGPRISAEMASSSTYVPEVVGAADSVYGSYSAAALKSHIAAISQTLGINLVLAQEKFPYGVMPSLDELVVGLDSRGVNERNILSQLWSRLIRHIILAAAAAREASLPAAEDEHFDYGLKILSNIPLFEIIQADVKADMLINAGITQKSRGNIDQAIKLFQDALYVNPGDGHAMVQLASLGSTSAVTATSLSDDYVAGLFDGYSDRFEQELVEELGYRGHEFVTDAVIRHGIINRNKKSYTFVDLGCGTGLAGSLLREKIGQNIDFRLLGVDLSSRMTEHSRARLVGDDNDRKRVYNDVYTMDGNDFLAGLPESSVDAIVSSDVFIYVGDLDDTFRECMRALRTNGILSFTVEMPSKNDDAAEHVRKHGMALLKSGRFGHSRKYVENVANNVGFKMVEWKAKVLRKQGKEDVPGAVVVLKKR
mmetsp:Transcript_31313/g.46734  ORF Transcript_31313/g.46734 Transcript_31313/m.46734 type:complete len:709 (-) Transcript_31313:35-2161(-)